MGRSMLFPSSPSCPSRLSCLCFFLCLPRRLLAVRSQAAKAPLRAPADWFTDRAEDAGLRFTHVNGMSGKFHYAEIIGSGVALFDMDNDGDLDVFLVQYQGQSRLFRNDLANGKLSFTDVTEKSGIVSRGSGMGVAAGDFDNDGCIDLVSYLPRSKPALAEQLRRHVH